jgi:hypothetical protein
MGQGKFEKRTRIKSKKKKEKKTHKINQNSISKLRLPIRKRSLSNKIGKENLAIPKSAS